MATIIPFPNRRKQTGELVEEIIATKMPHKDPAIRNCLKTEMTELVKKYFTGEEFSLSLVLPPDLNDEQFSQIEQGIKNTVSEHNHKLSQRTNQMFLDLCLSRMVVCELRHQLQKDP